MSASETAFAMTVERLCAAQRPVILVGPEAAPAAHAVVELAKLLGAAILTTPDAKAVIDYRDARGTFSFGASKTARTLVERADVVLAISALSEFTCRMGEAFRHHCLLQIAERQLEIGRNAQPVAALTGPHITETVGRLRDALASLIAEPRPAWCESLPSLRPAGLSLATESGSMHPIAAMMAIQAALPDEVRVCLDVTSGALHAYEHLQLTRQQRVFSSIENSACMGEALMASLGVRLASNLPTLVVVGDWGYAMSPSEIHTAVELGLGRYVVLVWANGGGAFIGAGIAQQGIAVPEPVWRWQTRPNFSEVARAYGARGVTVTDVVTLQDELSRALGETGPVLIEARIDPAAHVPAGDRFLTLGEGNACRPST